MSGFCRSRFASFQPRTHGRAVTPPWPPPVSRCPNSFMLPKSEGDSELAAESLHRSWKPSLRAGGVGGVLGRGVGGGWGAAAYRKLRFQSFDFFQGIQTQAAVRLSLTSLPPPQPPFLLQSLQEHIKSISSSHHML